MSSDVWVCLKWVFQANEPSDARFARMSPADHAALELALQYARHIGGHVTAVTVGPLHADAVLREALACGAMRAIRIDARTPISSVDVASAIASVARQASLVWCGDYSIDNGSGSVPAFLAASLAVSQALGVIAVSFEDQRIVATRRVDGGRREVLDVRPPAVISVEGATARLRRASLSALRAAAAAAIEVVTPTVVPTTERDASEHAVHTYRPRARALAAPSGADALDRVRNLTATGAASSTHEVETLPPADAAARIVHALTDWGYL